MKMPIHWLEDPEQHDYPAAFEYLSLHVGFVQARELVEKLQHGCPTITRKAKDIFRASGLPLLTRMNSHVAKNVQRIDKGAELSPVLLVSGIPHLLIADGYHRVCAVYLYDEDAEIPCRLATK